MRKHEGKQVTFRTKACENLPSPGGMRNTIAHRTANFPFPGLFRSEVHNNLDPSPDPALLSLVGFSSLKISCAPLTKMHSIKNSLRKYALSLLSHSEILSHTLQKPFPWCFERTGVCPQQSTSLGIPCDHCQNNSFLFYLKKVGSATPSTHEKSPHPEQPYHCKNAQGQRFSDCVHMSLVLL